MTKIIIKGKYWDKSWNPIVVKGGGWHCTKTSAGCLHCWAEQQNLRFGNKLPYDNRPVEFVLNEKILQQPLRRKIPTTYFVCDLCDLFHRDVPLEVIEEVYWTMLKAKQHTFLVLTKRIDRTLEFSKSGSRVRFMYFDEPSPNIHLGVSISTQKELDKYYDFCEIPAAKIFVSFEPLLSEIETHFRTTLLRKPNWVIIGCESINGRVGRLGEASPYEWSYWVTNIVRQCKAAGVPVFVKQLPIYGKVSKNMAEWPEELRVQEMPDGKD